MCEAASASVNPAGKVATPYSLGFSQGPLPRWQLTAKLSVGTFLVLHPAEFCTVTSPAIPSAGPRDPHESHLSHGRFIAASLTEQFSNVTPPIAP